MTTPKLYKSDMSTNLVWIDLELTGLDLDSSRIIEIASLVTNSELEVLAEGPHLVVHQDDAILSKIDYNIPVFQRFKETGLIDQVMSSKITQDEAEQQTIEFLKEYVLPKASPLCGNSVYMDRMFLIKYMPRLDDFLHYRLIDVSTVKSLYLHLGKNPVPYVKKSTHRALDDIRESVAELNYYRNKFFK